MADGSDLIFLERYLTSCMVCAERVNLALEALIVPCSICNSDFFKYCHAVEELFQALPVAVIPFYSCHNLFMSMTICCGNELFLLRFVMRALPLELRSS